MHEIIQYAIYAVVIWLVVVNSFNLSSIKDDVSSMHASIDVNMSSIHSDMREIKCILDRIEAQNADILQVLKSIDAGIGRQGM